MICALGRLTRADVAKLFLWCLASIPTVAVIFLVTIPIAVLVAGKLARALSRLTVRLLVMLWTLDPAS